MAKSKITSVLMLLLGSATALTLASTIPRSGGDEYGDSGNDDNGSAFSVSTSSSPPGNDELPARALSLAEIHGILGCVAFAFVFPTGGILLRALLPRWRHAVRLHAAWQAAGWALALATLGVGVRMADEEGYLRAGNFHAVIGLVACVGVGVQPVTGWVHHRLYKKGGVGGRTGWSYAHVAWGWGTVTLGVVNGGLGWWMEEVEGKYLVAYGVLAAAIWVLWVGTSVLSQLKGRRTPPMAEAGAVADRHDIPSKEGRMETRLREKLTAASSRSS